MVDTANHKEYTINRSINLDIKYRKMVDTANHKKLTNTRSINSDTSVLILVFLLIITSFHDILILDVYYIYI